VKAELGFEQPMMIGYAQDHEGYLLMPEDWLTGDYEPDIGIYGPLEAEYVMEQVLETSGPLLLTPAREEVDPFGKFQPTKYPDVPLPTDILPDETPDAGTQRFALDSYLWTPWVLLREEVNYPTVEELTFPAEVPRVQGLLQLAWSGGDPMVDSPEVVLERQEGGTWTPVTSGSGRPVASGRIDILLAHTPDPLYPVAGPQTHTWWAAWQAVSHWQDRAAMPLGTYRFTVTGQAKDGDTATWPWSTREYTFSTPSFEVVPGAISVTEDPYGAGLYLSLRSPERGYRLVHLNGDENGDNPVDGAVHVEIDTPSGTQSSDLDATLAAPRSFVPLTLPADWTEVRVTDAAGNHGTLNPLPPPVP
jgi:neutral ceramidase